MECTFLPTVRCNNLSSLSFKLVTLYAASSMATKRILPLQENPLAYDCALVAAPQFLLFCILNYQGYQCTVMRRVDVLKKHVCSKPLSKRSCRFLFKHVNIGRLTVTFIKLARETTPQIFYWIKTQNLGWPHHGPDKLNTNFFLLFYLN